MQLVNSNRLKDVVAGRIRSTCCALTAMLAVAVLSGCATTGKGTEYLGIVTAYAYSGDEQLLNDFAPVFVIEHDELAYNKIGTPSARLTDKGREEIYIDSAKPTIYQQVRTFETDKGAYTNLIYRVHFERSPFTWIPFNASAGKNVGAMAVITLNEKKEPVLLTTVQSCGCYHAITPTNFLDTDVFPESWEPTDVRVYGEDLPGILSFPEPFSSDAKIVITIQSGTHRTKGLRLANLGDLEGAYEIVAAPTAPMEALKSLPLGDDETTSFYYTEGTKRGLVKGAYKPWETVLFGLWAWDSHVGQDREYGSQEEVGSLFYTVLTASRKKRSDMWKYAGYLRHNGWKP